MVGTNFRPYGCDFLSLQFSPEFLHLNDPDTATTSHSFGDKGRKVTFCLLYYLECIEDEVWARSEHLRDTAHPLRSIKADYIAEFPVSMECHQCGTGTGTISITLLPL